MPKKPIRLSLVLFLSFIGNCSTETADSPASSWIESFAVTGTPITSLTPTIELVYSAKDANGNLYLSTNDSAGNAKWTIMRSADQGATWTTVDVNAANYSYGYGLANDSLGNVFVGGTTSANNTNFFGIVRQFNGSSWSNAFASIANAQFSNVAVSANDNVFALGTTRTNLFVMKSTNHGVGWSSNNVFTPYESRFSYGSALVTASSGVLYAAGYSLAISAGDVGGSWIRKSADGGTTWRTVYESTGSMRIRDMVEWNGGLAFIVDYDGGSDAGKIKVFATKDDFVHLSEIYSYAPIAPQTAFAGALAQDTRGFLYAAGAAADSDSKGHSFVAVTRNGTWETIFERNFGSAEAEYPDTLFFASDTNVSFAAPYTDGVNSGVRVYQAAIKDTAAPPLSTLTDGSSRVSPIPPNAKIIYVTSATFQGNLGGTAAAAVATADGYCNSDGNKPIYATGSFKALIAASGVRIACTTSDCGGGVAEHTNWPLAGSQAYVTRSGRTLGTTNAAGLFTTDFPQYMARYYTNGVWSGLTQDAGSYWVLDGSGNCSDWTSNNSSDTAWTFDPSQLALGDFYSTGFANSSTCDSFRPLICVEQ